MGLLRLKKWNRMHLGLLFLLSAWTPLAMADCQTDYEQALTLLNNAQKKAMAGEHPSQDAFTQTFQKAIDKMRVGKCQAEMVKLTEHIQAEQQKYPPAVPLED